MPTIGKNIRPMPDGRFRVRYKLGKKERKKICASEAEARQFLKDEKKGILATGRGHLLLTESQRRRVMLMLEDLSANKGFAHGVAVLETAVQHYKKHAPKKGIPMVADAVEQLIAKWKVKGRDRTYISNAGGVLRRFATAHPMPIDKVSPLNVSNWLDSLAGTDKKTSKARVSKLLSFAVLNEWIKVNYLKDMQVDRTTPKSIPIPSFGEIDELLSALENSEKYRPLLRPYTKRLYAGPRTKESLDERVREEDGMMIVPAGAAAKKGPARQYRLSEAYMASAKWCDDKKLPFLDRGQFNRLDLAFRKEIGISGQTKWNNWQRHSYASYMIPLLKGDLDELAEQMGNSPQTLRNHYLGNVQPEDVPRFWSRRPRN
jgi:integrase